MLFVVAAAAATYIYGAMWRVRLIPSMVMDPACLFYPYIRSIYTP